MIRKIEWCEELPPSKECSYDHIKGKTALGDFMITWKGWKEHPSYDVDTSPWGEWVGSGVDLDDAKEIAQKAFENKIAGCLTIAI